MVYCDIYLFSSDLDAVVFQMPEGNETALIPFRLVHPTLPDAPLSANMIAGLCDPVLRLHPPSNKCWYVWTEQSAVVTQGLHLYLLMLHPREIQAVMKHATRVVVVPLNKDGKPTPRNNKTVVAPGYARVYEHAKRHHERMIR